jgi:hypothetical protein
MLDNFGNEVYGCIYKFTNIVNYKIYIGQTIDFIQRMKEEIYELDENKRKSNLHFQNAWNKYGKENFIQEIIDYADSKIELNSKEKEWVWFYKSNDGKFGYNLTEGGNGGDTMSNHPNKKEIYAKLQEKKEKARLKTISNPIWKATIGKESYRIAGSKRKGKPSGRKGKKLEEICGIEKATELRLRYSKNRRGFKHKQETKNKIGDKHSGKNNYNYRHDIDKKISEIVKFREKGYTYSELGKMFKCNSGLIKKKLHNYYIENNKENIEKLNESKSRKISQFAGIKNLSENDKIEIVQSYQNNIISIGSLARKFKCSGAVIKFLLNENNIIKKDKKVFNGIANCKKVINIDTNQIFNTINSAAKEFKVPSCRITECCVGKREVCTKGFHWQYYNE